MVACSAAAARVSPLLTEESRCQQQQAEDRYQHADDGCRCRLRCCWQLFPSLAIDFADSFSLDLGYRWLDIDYSTGEGNELFTYDVLTQGPVVGVGFRF